MDLRTALPAGLVVLGGAALGVWFLAAPTEPAATGEGTAPVASVPQPTQATPPAPPARPAEPPPPPSADPVDPVQEAFVDHARRAEPGWRASARILEHANPPVYGDIAHQLADRMAAVTPHMTPGERQELVVEERQFIEHLRQRYEGLPELEALLDDLDADLAEVQDQITEVGPSPDPRERSARGAELPHGD